MDSGSGSLLNLSFQGSQNLNCKVMMLCGLRDGKQCEGALFMASVQC
jgi:putative hemolysin